MIHLSWNLARNIKVSDPRLYELIKLVVILLIFTVCYFYLFYFLFLQNVLNVFPTSMWYNFRIY